MDKFLCLSMLGEKHSNDKALDLCVSYIKQTLNASATKPGQKKTLRGVFF